MVLKDMHFLSNTSALGDRGMRDRKGVCNFLIGNEPFRVLSFDIK